MQAKWAKPCERCSVVIPVGADCTYNPATKKISHIACPTDLFTKTAEEIANDLHFVPASTLDSETEIHK